MVRGVWELRIRKVPQLPRLCANATPCQAKEVIAVLSLQRLKAAGRLAFYAEPIVCLLLRHSALLRSRRQKPGKSTWRLYTARTFRHVDTS
jgi:hypothetical protein